MNDQHQQPQNISIRDFRLPRYDEIPNVGLYLEQTAKYINEYLLPIQDGGLTGSMISNYVKKKLVANPVKKQYDREQIAYLLFIAVVKSVLSLDNIGALIQIQKERYDSATAYNYFCDALEQGIHAVFALSDGLPALDPNANIGKVLLRNAMVAVAHKIYLDKSFAALESGEITAE